MQVEGNTTFSTKAIQVPLSATSLNSNYCFMLRKASHYYVWCGSYSTGDNREMAKLFAGSDFALILEGSESGDFWYNIGGQDEYTTVKCQKEAKADLPARLFHCTIGKRTFKGNSVDIVKILRTIANETKRNFTNLTFGCDRVFPSQPVLHDKNFVFDTFKTSNF